ncbi:HAD family phosphatase [Isoptericola variabilis]|uniref:HAD-superfamily hydrolase, subfamily IA, variant 3 n=1 Tax=Isoptericola variabilis (strain 225) TaxID=743718 RepID=F6FV10_ISOV2|nr:HAD family phosphatase [Isoptericola variabilis]AEG44350.1 HAD-superfamily hydrolase, subfamily IA, variant 3 [Isoptericola variabilis 225]TWH31062.1 2-haloacid dehalogenase [Isoptericola variabilis J7]
MPTGPAAAIDTAVYDFGNVLVRWDPYGAFTGHDRAEVERWMTEIDFPAFNHAQDAGRTWDEARAALADRPHLVPFVDAYVAGFAGTLLGPVDGSAELAAELKGLGLRLYGLTNWSAELFHHAETVASAVGLMDDVVVSGRVGLAKPDPRIFAHLARAFDVDPARAVFVDDSPANVAAARDAGFHAVHFTGTAAFRAALRDLGVPVRPA